MLQLKYVWDDRDDGRRYSGSGGATSQSLENVPPLGVIQTPVFFVGCCIFWLYPNGHALSIPDQRSPQNGIIGVPDPWVLLREARTPRLDALFTEMVATRMLLNLVLKPLACGEVVTAEEFSGVLTHVRTTKRQAAADVMQQYTNPGK